MLEGVSWYEGSDKGSGMQATGWRNEAYAAISFRNTARCRVVNPSGEIAMEYRYCYDSLGGLIRSGRSEFFVLKEIIMKRQKSTYDAHQIDLWPNQTVLSAAITLFFGGFLIVLWILWRTYAGMTGDAIILAAILLSLVAIILTLLFCMFGHYQITRDGVYYRNEMSGRERRIQWKDVSEVRFYRDPWKGGCYFQIFLDKPGETKNGLRSRWDFTIPYDSEAIDIDILLGFIPDGLLASPINPSNPHDHGGTQ